MTFDRKLYDELGTWKKRTRRKPLVLQGARQTGKTWLLKEFGKRAFQKSAYFNFEERPDLKQLFELTKDVKRIVQNLSLVHGETIDPEHTLIILDEIQECNAALNSLKYFQENAPEYAIVSAGSLLGVALGRDASFPVGKVDFLTLYPLSFSEFLAAADSSLSSYLDQMSHVEPIPDIFFNPLLEKLRLYTFAGGMPEAASTLLETLNPDETEQALKNILRAYQLDFSKHIPSREVVRIGHLWNSIPAQLAKENKKFIYQVIKSGARAREYEEALQWLNHAGLVYKINRSNKPHLPISAYDDLSAFKLYLTDTGLLRSMSNLDQSTSA